jgi:hypothetical protein
MKRWFAVASFGALLTLPGLADPLSFTFTNFDVLGSASTRITGANDSGLMVGWYTDANGTHGFTLQNGNESQFTALTATNATTVLGVNDNGDMVGFTGAVNTGIAFIYNAAGNSFTQVPLNSFGSPNAVLDQATGINGNGLVTGFYAQSGITKGYTDNGGTISFPITEAGATNTTLTGLNLSGTIVGFGGFSGGINKAFTDTSGTFSSAYLAPGSASTCFQGIDTAGDIVGDYAAAGGCSTNTQGLLLVGGINGTLMTLNFPDVNAQSTKILGISPDGTRLVGTWTDGSTNHGFYATLNTPGVPEPGTILMTLGGLGLLAGMKLRRRKNV